MTANLEATWIANPKYRAARRVVIAHHAGGAGSYFMPLAKLLESELEVVMVDLPGHGAKTKKSLLTDLKTAGEVVYQDLSQLEPKPTLLVGHSMGSLVILEVARRLAPNLLQGLIFSAARFPDGSRDTNDYSDAGLTKKLLALGGTSDLVFQYPELMEMFLPIFRADLQMIDAYRCEGLGLFRCPLHFCYGLDDSSLVPEDQQAWLKLTSGPAKAHEFGGGHFYLNNHWQDLASLIRTSLA